MSGTFWKIFLDQRFQIIVVRFSLEQFSTCCSSVEHVVDLVVDNRGRLGLIIWLFSSNSVVQSFMSSIAMKSMSS